MDFHLHLNGQFRGVLEGRRGLRQGDPLSRLLFVLSMDYLSRLLKVVKDNPKYKLHPNCKKLGITHLLSPDVLMLFSKADLESLQLLMEALYSFHATAGLKANLQKSQIVIGEASHELYSKCLHVSRLQESQLPIRYLGVHITDGRLNKIECSSLIEKITSRIHIWAIRNISFAGRALLINNVIFGSFNYRASIFLLQNEVLDKLTQLCRN